MYLALLMRAYLNIMEEINSTALSALPVESSGNFLYAFCDFTTMPYHTLQALMKSRHANDKNQHKNCIYPDLALAKKQRHRRSRLRS